ncbi:MAG: hypothetical protein JXB49_13340 [Bacteroidales bacterium]|nr:hypothetical protein [Bacteroidales bacterium]
MNNKKRILVCPINWGLGHAGRCIPVINYFLEKDHEVVIGADGQALAFLRQEFPELAAIPLPDMDIHYSRGNTQVLKIIAQIPKIVRSIRKEHLFVKELVQQERFDLIVSDNRYGVWHPDVPSVIITHQLMLKLPGIWKFFEKAVHKWFNRHLASFIKCLVPDVENFPGLSGDLAHKYKLKNVEYIGPLTHFSSVDKDVVSVKSTDVLIVLSGPEPQRTKLEDILLAKLRGTSLKVKLVQGKPGIFQRSESNNIEMVSFLGSKSLVQEINKSKIIICRAGYTSIMDMAILGTKALLIPTPGQTEQEYLARHLKKLGYFDFISQKELSLINTLKLKSILDSLKECKEIPDELRRVNLAKLSDIFS